MVGKNTPHMSNSSKLMQQLQLKEKEKAKLASKQNFEKHNKENIYSKTKQIHNRSKMPPGSQKHSKNSALSQYSKEASSLGTTGRNAVFTENGGFQSKQFLTFTAPSNKKKEHKKNKSLGAGDRLILNNHNSEVQSPTEIDSLRQIESNSMQTYNSYSSENKSNLNQTVESMKSAQLNVANNFSMLTNRLIRKQVSELSQ